MQSESINMSISSTFINEGIRIFLFTSLSHCKVHYRFDREGAVSWLHQLPPEGLVACAGPSDATKDLFHCCQRLFGVCPANRWRAAGWDNKNIQKHILLPLKNVCLGGGMRGYPGCFVHFYTFCPYRPGNRETPMSFPCLPWSKLREGLFVHLLPDSMQPLHREL